MAGGKVCACKVPRANSGMWVQQAAKTITLKVCLLSSFMRPADNFFISLEEMTIMIVFSSMYLDRPTNLYSPLKVKIETSQL
jgi:hypothetical protein